MPLRILMPLIWLIIILATSVFSYLYVERELTQQVREDTFLHVSQRFDAANHNLNIALDLNLSKHILMQMKNGFEYEEEPGIVMGYQRAGDQVFQLSDNKEQNILETYINTDFSNSAENPFENALVALCQEKRSVYALWPKEDVFYLFKPLKNVCEGNIHILRYSIGYERRTHLAEMLQIVIIYTMTLLSAMLVIGGFSYGVIHQRFQRLLKHISGYRHSIENEVDVIEGGDEFASISKAFFGMAKRLNGVLDDMYTFVAVLDTKGEVVFVNNTPLQVSEIGFADVKGKKLSRTYWWAYDDTTCFEIDKLIDRALNGEIINEESQIQIAGGRLIWINFSMHPVYGEDGCIEHLVAEGVDISRQKQAYEEMLRQSRKAQMGEMLSVIAHQWRQPLGVISSVANKIILDIELGLVNDKELRLSMDKINHTVTHLGSTMHQFTSFFNPNKKEELTSFLSIVNKCTEILGSKLESEGVHISLELGDEIKFLSFEEELMQVVMDMMKNSADFFKINAIKNPQLTLRQMTYEDYVCLEIEDNAGGIKDEDMEDLFKPYFSTKPQEGGTGLGLHMSKMIVEDHCRGEIKVQQLENGACFTICIPRND